MRLLESALVVFSQKGVDATVIDDVIAAADVSRGTFYNYFRTNGELLGALGEALGNELIELIEASVVTLDDPVQRLASGLRMFLRTAKAYPRFAGFMWRAGFNASSAGNLIYVYLPRHIAEAIARGSLTAPNAATALHVLVGIALAATFAISTQDVDEDYPEQMVRHILLALGVTKKEADRLIALPLAEIHLSDRSLLARTRDEGGER